MKLSVIIVSYNVCDQLVRCLSALGDENEIIIVDNASSDNSVDTIRSRFPFVRLIAWPKNRGFSAAVNCGVREASGDLILLLNPDTILQTEQLKKMPEAFIKDEDAVAIGFRQIDDDGNYQLTIGPPPSLLLEIMRCLVQRRLDAGKHRIGRFIDNMLNHPRIVPWVAASVLLVKRQAFEQINGFDEGFFLYFEDIDFCLRLRANGGKVYYDPTITVIHTRGASAKSTKKLAKKAYRESQIYYWRKYKGALFYYLIKAYQRVFRLV
ncbi:MAG: glycosyltransferase family 2 protein [Deltaproteobacteria bacterium]|nr:glycosyltransferase family 2 protein [Deltaproteobacteria bacterium]